MINLAPKTHKESLRYARRNSMLWRWLMGVLIITFFAIAVIIAGKIHLQSEINRVEALNKEASEQLQADNLEETLDEIEAVSSNLKLIIDVLSNRVIFSKLITQIGSVMPDGAILSDIEISETQGGIDLIATARDYNTATQVQVNLEDPDNKIFDKVDLVGVECISDTDIYPCRIVMRALFTESNPYLFINLQKAEANN